MPYTTHPSGDITSKASSAANLTTLRNLLVTSRKESVVEWMKLVVPFCSPRTILPSFLYCSSGSSTRSRTPYTSCRKACISPTPPSSAGSCPDLMSASQAVAAVTSSLSRPRMPCLSSSCRRVSSLQLRVARPARMPVSAPWVRSTYLPT